MKGIGKKSLSVLMTLVMLVGIIADLRWGFSAVEVFAATYEANVNYPGSYVTINGQIIDSSHNTVDFSNGSYPFGIHLEWSISNGQPLQKGDIILVKLPEEIAFENVPQGTQTVGFVEAGTYTVKDGYLTITITRDDVSSNATGINDLKGTLNNDTLSNLDNGEYSFSIFDKHYTIDVQNQTKGSSLNTYKYTNGDTYDSEKGYNYVVEVFSQGTNSGITVKDYFGTNMELTSGVTVSSSIPGKSVTGSLSQSTENGFTYTIDPNYVMADGEKLYISYSAKVSDSTFDSFNGSLSVKNTATVKSSESGEKSSEVTKYLSRNLVSKSAQLSADGQSVNWTITINSSNPIDVSSGTISDLLPGDYEITSDVVMTSSKGGTVILPNDGRSFSYTFPQGSKDTYTIRFTTSVDTSSIPVVSGGNTSPNKAHFELNNKPYDSNDAYVHIPGIPNFHTKKASSYEVATIDGKDVGVIHWVNTITVPDPAICPLYDFVFYDNGASWQQVTQKVRDGSLSVSYNGANVAASNYHVNVFNTANTFQIDFGDYFAGAKKDDTIVISYDTYFDLVSYETWIYNYSQVKLDNKTVSESSDSYKFVPLINKSIVQTQDNGLNKVFKWCVKFDLSNYDALPDMLVFKDILPENQKLVPGTIELWNSMWWDGNPQKISGATETDGIFSVEIGKSQLNGKKEPSGNFVYLHYDTTFDNLGEFLMGGSKNYVNAVEVHDKSTGALIDKASASTGTITPPENKAVDKRLVLYNDYTAGFAYYAIDVNTAGLKYLKEDGAQLKLTDKLGNALSYVVGSLKVYTDPGYTHLMPSDQYTLSYDKNANELILLLPDATPCYITYTAKVTISKDKYPTFSSNPADPNYAGNDVKLEGQGSNSIKDKVTLSGTVANTTGTITYNHASISLYKSDIANFANGLPGAKYTARVVAIWENGTWLPATDEELAKRNIENSVITRETDADGWISFSPLRYDFLYEITETAAPNGYQINSDVAYIYFVGIDNSDYKTALAGVAPYAGHEIIEVKRDEDDTSGNDLYHEMLVSDKKLPRELKYIEISKQAAFGTTSELEGATLRIKDNTDKVIAEWTTGSSSRKFHIYEDGIDESEYNEVLLRPGVNYTLEETAAPSGFTIAKPITFSVDNNGNISGIGSNTLVMKDNRAIYINKVDSDGNSLSGAELTITGGSSPITFTTDGSAHRLEVSADGSNGTLRPGVTYTLSETITPGGYKTIEEVKFSVDDKGIVTVVSGADGKVTSNGVTLTVTDKTLVALKVVKQDTNGNLLSGAEFSIEYLDGTSAKPGTFTTNASGEVLISDLTYGDYVLVEVTAPAGYNIISEKTPITLGGTGANVVPIVNGVATKTITNSRILNEKGNIKITKTNSGDNTALSGAVFTLTNAAGTAFYTATATTDKNGVAEFSDVPYGTYTLTEKDAPYGYAFTVSDRYSTTDSHGILNAVIGNASCTVTLDADSTGSSFGTTNTFEISATNSQLYGSLRFNKVDSDGRPVSGAQFTLVDSKNAAKTYTATSDAAGKVEFTNLPYGTYTLKETSTPDYYTGWFRTEGLSVTINSENVVTLSNIVNTKLRVSIDKRSLEEASTLSGATLGIYAKNDTTYTTPLITWTTGTAPVLFELGAATTENGGIKYIAPGEYILHEITPPANYKRAADITFEVEYNNTSRTAGITSAGNVENGVLVMRDEPIGTLRLLKKDSKINVAGGNDPLPGAAFELYKVSDDGTRTQIVENSVTHTAGDGTSYTDVYVTDENGEINIPALSYGTYVFEEVCPPDGYIITNASTTFVLQSDLEEQIVYNTEKVDQRGNIEIQKVDPKTGTVLEDARFDLYRYDGDTDNFNFIAGNTTNSGGTIVFENMPYGKYALVETELPKDFTVDLDAENYGVEIIDSTGKHSTGATVDKEGRFAGKLKIELTIDENMAIYTDEEQKNGEESGQFTGGRVTISVGNVKEKRPFYVKKTDSDTAAGLIGAEFALYKDKECKNKVGDNVATDNNGIAEFTDVEHGTYWLKEEKAPEGYEITQTAPVRVVLDDNTKNLYTQDDPLTVSDDRIILHINKYATGTMTTVPGAGLTIESTNSADNYKARVWSTGNIQELTLYLADNAASANALNDKGNGNYIYPGTFTLEETTVPSGYLPAKKVTFKVSDTGVITFDGTAPEASDAEILDGSNLILYDEPCGSVRITKSDAENEKLLLDGVEFSIYNAADVEDIDSADDLNGVNPLFVLTTGDTSKGFEKGTLVFDKLPLGEYAIFETSVPEGYLRVSKKYNVNITSAGQEISLQISNIHEASAGNIKLKKTAEDDGSALEGAVFKLVNANDESIEVATGRTDDKGEVTFTNVLFGTYKLIEVVPPDGYSISLKDTTGHTKDDYVVNSDGSSITVTVNKENCEGADEANKVLGILSVNVTDDIQRGNLEVSKTDSKSGVGLLGVEFVLKNEKGEYFTNAAEFTKDEYKFTTDAKGKIEIKNIPFGTYVLEEVSTPDGYVSVLGTDDAKKTVVIAEQIVVIDKDGRQTTDKAYFTNDVLTANFTIRKIGTGDDKWADDVTDTVAGLEGAVYDLYSDAACENLVATGITGEDGRYTFEGLAYGTYYLKESKAPINYMVDPEEIEITIPDQFSVDVTAGIMQNKNVDDAIGKGSLIIEKRDELTDELLSGATFELYGLADDSDGKLIDTKTTDASGKVIFEDLDYGYYMVKETGVPTYYMAVTEDVDSIPVTADEVDKDGNVTVVVTNRNISFQISKRAANSIIELGGATLGIFPDNTTDFEHATPLLDWISSDEDPEIIYLGSTGKTDNKLLLSPGTYILAELDTPAGYLKANPMRFSVDETGEVTLLEAGIGSTDDGTAKRTPGALLNEEDYSLLVMYDDEDVGKSIAVSKKDILEDGSLSTTELVGAKLKIVDAANEEKVLVSWTSQEQPRVISVGVGKVLQYETNYRLVEESAPQGYVLAEPIPFHIRRDGTIVIGSVGEGGTSLSGEVSVYATPDGVDVSLLTMKDKISDGRIYISKQTVTGVELSGATLAVIDKETDTQIDQWISNGDSHEIRLGIKDTTLQTGRTYILRELAAPEGFKQADDIEFTVLSDETISLTDPEGPGRISADKKTLTMVDEYSQAIINISKRELNQTNELAGALLQVINKSTGDVVQEWTSASSARSLTVGFAATDILKPDGTVYILHEAAHPKGYLLANDIEFHVDVAGVITLEDPANGVVAAGDVQTLVMQDARRESALIVISKKAVGGEGELAGAALSIQTMDGTKVDEWTSGNIAHEVTVGVGGKLSFSTTYILHEETAPLGYVVAEDIRFSVDVDGNIISEGELSEDGTILTMRDPVWDNTVSLSKKAVGGMTELSGTKLSILNENGNVIDTWTASDEAHKLTTGTDGTLKFATVYILHEDAAPSGYLLTDDIRFVVEPNGTMSVINSDGVVVTSDNLSSDAKMLTLRDPIAPTSDAFTDVPKTGDDTPIVLLIILLIIAIVVIAGLFVTGRKNKAVKGERDDNTGEEE